MIVIVIVVVIVVAIAVVTGRRSRISTDFNLLANFDFSSAYIELVTTDESVIVFAESMEGELMGEVDGTR